MGSIVWAQYSEDLKYDMILRGKKGPLTVSHLRKEVSPPCTRDSRLHKAFTSKLVSLKKISILLLEVTTVL